MDLSDTRTRIDAVDAELLRLFGERMALARDVAAAKIEAGLPIFDPAREREKLTRIAAMAPTGLEDASVALFSLLMSMNKVAQHRIMADRAIQEPASARIRAQLLDAATPFPQRASVACQGVEGAYSQIAACRLFAVPAITYCPRFGDVFAAVEDGSCAFGVLPIENSTAGSVNAVFDLMAKSRTRIVRSFRMKIEHALLAQRGAQLADIREVVSHEQALNQCAGYLKRLGATTTVCENTARAAAIVASSERRDLAALSSIGCAELYGLAELDRSVQDSDSNYTRFAVISREPVIYPGANRTTVMLTLKHEPGALFSLLERLYALSINLLKLESRPIPGRDFEFRFYFDLEVEPGSEAFGAMLDSLDDVCCTWRYFGSYLEIV